MVYTHLLLRTGEIFLKGKNRAVFENRLVNNLKNLLNIKVKGLRFRFITDYFSEHKILKKVFGLTSYSPAVRTEKDLTQIKETALNLLTSANFKAKTFKIETKRPDKTFPLQSPAVNVEVGRFIEENSHLVFNLKNPQQRLNIEINQDGAYLFLETVQCHGGLPVGVEGQALLLVENKASLLAGLLLMRRGCQIIPIAFKEKDISLLQKYNPSELKLEVVKDFSVLDELAVKKKISIIVSGQNFENYNDYKTNLLVFRPLIASDEQKINLMLKNFST